jgi:putative resolvase
LKLSQYARIVGVTYRSAFRWWQNGQIKGYQLPSGTIVVTEEDQRSEKMPEGLVVIYTRVSSHEHRANLERQAKRLEDYCAAKGYRNHKVVKEIGSEVNDNRAKFMALLEDQRIATIVVEHQDQASRFGFRYVEVLNLADNDQEDLLHDLVSVIYSFGARLYRQRRAKRKTEAIVAQLKQGRTGETNRAASDPQG